MKLPRAFYARPATEVAPDLLGTVLVRSTPQGIISGRIVEVEAYAGQTDPGSHAFRGPTPRSAVMFGPAGHVYVYLSHGIHSCMNVVTGSPGGAGAVLLRALEPLEGIPLMERNRGGRPLPELCSGPGKLCQALQVTRADNGADLEGNDLWIVDDGVRPGDIAITTRVGLSQGRELPWRFLVRGNAFVSRGRPSLPVAHQDTH